MSYRENVEWQRARKRLCDGLANSTPDENFMYRIAAIHVMFKIELASQIGGGDAA
ncbi:hypothetical protein [Glutamicibacter protophormiae]|uniref:hypothetical protein n=1 Tax=Glutamicibacter protophormiae TaxID=37930 RepID=UPI0033232B2E